jgi:hypothetical protein
MVMKEKPKREQDAREATRLGEEHGTEPSDRELREDVRQGEAETERPPEKKT